MNNMVVMITGATGGLGEQLTRAFVSAGHRVVAVARSSDALQNLAEALPEAQLLPVQADVAIPGQVGHAVEMAIEKFDRIDVLFNNAAVYPKVSFLEQTSEQWMDAIGVNLGGISNCSRAVLPIMIANGYGRIFNLGSFADLAPLPASSAYSCSKGGVHGLTKAIYQDVKGLDLDIEIHEWIPGHLKTGMSDFTGIDPAISAEWGVRIATGEIAASAQCVLFENDRQWVEPTSICQKIKAKLLFWR